jgi:UDP-N-acetylglucosamine:LPS N-acetylglucosamine transferase
VTSGNSRAVDEETPADRRRVLIVTAAMGGGHLQVSRELERRLATRGHDVSLVDLNELMPGPTGEWLQRLYPWLVNRAPWLYDVIYRTFFLARQRTGERARVPVLLALPGLRRLVQRLQPDVVVSTYHLAALAVARLRHRGVLHCPAVTFITTFSVHNLWTHPGADLNLCISDAAARDAARRSGRPAAVCGPVVRAEFAGPPAAPEEVRRRFGIPTDATVALVVAGSLGMGPVERTVSAIAAAGWLPVVVCGRNAELHRSVELLGVDCVVLDWVDEMADLMSAADVLLENAGGLSSKEALCRGLPVVTFNPIAGHGRDDAQALARLGLTDIVDDEQGLATALQRLRSEPDARQARLRAGRALFRDDAARVISGIARGRSRPADLPGWVGPWTSTRDHAVTES